MAVTLEEIKVWRQARHDAGMPSGLKDYFIFHNVCRRCKGAKETVDGHVMPDLTFKVTTRVACSVCNGDGLYHEGTT